MPRFRRRGPAGPWTASTWLVLVMLGLPLGAFFNLASLSGVGSAAMLATQQLTGTSTTGVITDSRSHTVQGRRAPDETYCFGFFRPDDPDRPQVKVRIYAEGSCRQTKGRSAIQVPGAATPLSNLIIDPTRVGGPMPFNGLLGMTEGAVVDWGPFWRGLWPFLFLIPIAVGFDVGLTSGLCRQLALRRERQRTA